MFRLSIATLLAGVVGACPANAQDDPFAVSFPFSQVGWQAELITRSPVGSVNISGTVTIINETTLRVSNFSYTGSGGGAVEFRLSPLQNDIFYEENRSPAATSAFNQITANDDFTDGFAVVGGQTVNNPAFADGIDDFPNSDFAVNVGGPQTLRGTAPDPQNPLIGINTSGPISGGINPDFPAPPNSPEFPNRFVAGDQGDVLFENASFDIDLGDALFPTRGEIDGSGDSSTSNVFDFGGIAVWCDPFNLDFGSGQFRSPDEIGILMGDFNDDGVVDAADFTVWRDELGRTDVTPFTDGDANGDGAVTTDDFDIWSQNFGATSAAVAAALVAGDVEPVDGDGFVTLSAVDQALLGVSTFPVSGNAPPAVVPEPASLAVALVLTAALPLRRRRLR